MTAEIAQRTCGPCSRGQHACCDGNEYVRCDCHGPAPKVEKAQTARIKAQALRDFAEQVCDRNAKYGLTSEARHFGETYARLARAEAAVAESVAGGGDRD